MSAFDYKDNAQLFFGTFAKKIWIADWSNITFACIKEKTNINIRILKFFV